MAALPRRISLPQGDLVVRHVRIDDAPALQDLYEGLGAEDRGTRFFSSIRPQRSFYAHLASVEERGGGGVVAVLVPGDDPDVDLGPIVAEASYEPLENGTGEMAMTVDADWRGWLGAYVLATLCTVAAGRGLGNLEARILTRNRPMRSLTRARGEVYLPGSDWESVRVSFATEGLVPDWGPAGDRRRVLLEMRGAPWEVLDGMRAAGYDVVACPGPSTRECPLLMGGECPLAADADAIVLALPRDDGADDLLRAHAREHGTVPVAVVELGTHRPITAAAVSEAVARATGEAS